MWHEFGVGISRKADEGTEKRMTFERLQFAGKVSIPLRRDRRTN